MQCEETRKYLFEYHEGRLPDLERQAVDKHLEQCAECSGLLSEIWEMALVASSWREQTVPRWNRRALFFSDTSLYLPWLNLASVAASVVILVVLIFQVEIRSTADGLVLAAGGSGNAITLEELDRRFRERDLELADVLATNNERLTAQQVATNQLLLRTILQTSREERREDLMDVMSVWQSDRQQMTQMTEESFGYLIRTQLAGQRQLQELSSAVRDLDIREDNNL